MTAALADYHMHTPLCRHAVGEPTEYAAQAVKLGLSEIGFSDHSPMPRDDFDDWRMRAAQLDQYVAKVNRARRDHPDLIIKMGLEVDYLPGYEDWIRDLAGRHSWDYFIGSVHYIAGQASRQPPPNAGEPSRPPSAETGVPDSERGSNRSESVETPDLWAIDNPQTLSEWKRREPLEVWSAYFERLIMAAESGLFDIVGHADLCKKFCFYPSQDCTALFVKFLDAVKGSGMVIELNTAGLRKECREIYPSLNILRLAADRKVPITFGSDAHAPEEVGAGFPEAVQLAREAGYKSYCRFTERRSEETPLFADL